MLYKEYLDAAYKHLASCRALESSLTSQPITEPWRRQGLMSDCYYLAGLIMESLTAYVACHYYDYPAHKDIKTDYDRDFTSRSGIDFYDNGKRKSFRNGIANEVVRLENPYSLVHHRFNDIIHGPLATVPELGDIPYLGRGPINVKIHKLLCDWSTNARYQCHGYSSFPELGLDMEELSELVDTCEMACKMTSEKFPYPSI